MLTLLYIVYLSFTPKYLIHKCKVLKTAPKFDDFKNKILLKEKL